MLSGMASVQQRDLFVQAFLKKKEKVFTTVYDTILFLYSVYNQFYPVTNFISLIIFSFQTLFMSSLIFERI